MYQLSTEPQSIGRVLDASFKLYGATFRDVLPFALILAILAVIPALTLFARGAAQDPQALVAAFTTPSYFITAFLTGLLSFAFYIAMLARMEAFAQGRRIALGAALDTGLRRFVRAYVATLLYGLLSAVGLILLVVPGLIVMVSLLFALPAIAVDNKRLIESLNYSHNLVWGAWWRTATLVTIGMIVPVVLVYFGPGVIVGMLAAILKLDAVVLMIFQFALVAVATLLIAPYFLALCLEVYRDLKLRKEGGDLAARISQVQGA